MKQLSQEEMKQRALEHLAKPGVIDELIDRLDDMIVDEDGNEIHARND